MQKAALSCPISTNADCIPGSTFTTLPLYILPAIPLFFALSKKISARLLLSRTATLVSLTVELIIISFAKLPPMFLTNIN